MVLRLVLKIPSQRTLMIAHQKFFDDCGQPGDPHTMALAWKPNGARGTGTVGGRTATDKIVLSKASVGADFIRDALRRRRYQVVRGNQACQRKTANLCHLALRLSGRMDAPACSTCRALAPAAPYIGGCGTPRPEAPRFSSWQRK